MAENVEENVEKLTEKYLTDIATICNDVSVGFFRLQEHVRKDINAIVPRKAAAEGLRKHLNGARHDLDHSVETLKKLHTLEDNLARMKTNVRKMLFMQGKR